MATRKLKDAGDGHGRGLPLSTLGAGCYESRDMSTYTQIDPTHLLRAVWEAFGGEAPALQRVRFADAGAVLPSGFHVDAVAQATVAAAGLAAAEVWRTRTGQEQDVVVNPRHAAAAFRSQGILTIDGTYPPTPWTSISGYYQAGDERWVQLHCNFPHHRDGVLEILGVEEDRQAVASAIAKWKAEELERETRAAGLCVAFLRTPEEWRGHPHALALTALPLLEVSRIADAPPVPLPQEGERPLSGIRVADLTRVVAGPVCGRTLASHGADVLRIAAPHLPFVETLVVDTGLGKRSAHVDLRGEEGRAAMRELVSQADVFVNGYRPGALAAHGFSLPEITRLRPGIVYTTLSAYGHLGPWSGWRGFDSLTQSATGIVHEETAAAGSDTPRPLPCQALDHATGYLAAFGTMVALKRRAEEGGSWMVRVSLAQTGRWLESLGRVRGGLECRDPRPEDFSEFLERRDSPFGRLLHVAPPAVLSQTPSSWALPPVPLGSHEPVWLPR